jgi:DNA primase
MKISGNKIDEIIAQIEPQDVISDYVRLSKKGNKLWGLCPFHHEKTPSFTVDPEKGLYYCFGCGKGGSLFNFIMEMEKVSFPDAVKLVAKKAGIQIEQGTIDPADRREDAILNLNNRVAGSLHYILTDKEMGRNAIDYLKQRHISDGVIKAFTLGYAPSNPDWIYNFLKKKNFSIDFLKDSGLFSKKYAKKSIFVNRIIFPIANRGGDIVGFGGRLLAGSGPKYINSAESNFFKKRNTLYRLDIALQPIRKSSEFYLVEGYLDVLSLYEAGIKNVVAPLGTSFTEGQAKILKRYAEKGVIVFDGDQAGINATRKAAEILENNGIHCEVVRMAENKDPADILVKEGAQALQKILKYRISSFDFILSSTINLYDIRSPEGKAFVIKNLFPYIDGMDSEVKQVNCLEILADRLQADRKSVINDFYKKNNRTGTTIDTKTEGSNLHSSIDLYLMLALIKNRENYPQVRNIIKIGDLIDENARELFILLEDAYRDEESSTELLLEKIGDEQLKTIITNKLSSEEFGINQDKIIRDATKQIKRRSLVSKKNKIISKLRLLKADEGLNEDINSLQLEIMYLDEEIKKLREDGSD